MVLSKNKKVLVYHIFNLLIVYSIKSRYNKVNIVKIIILEPKVLLKVWILNNKFQNYRKI